MALTGRPWQVVENCQIAASQALLANPPFFVALPCDFVQPQNLQSPRPSSLRQTLP